MWRVAKIMRLWPKSTKGVAKIFWPAVAKIEKVAKIVDHFGHEMVRGQNLTKFWPRVAKIRRAWPKLTLFRCQSFGRGLILATVAKIHVAKMFRTFRGQNILAGKPQGCSHKHVWPKCFGRVL